MNQEAEAKFLASVLRYPDKYWSINDVRLVVDDFVGIENRKVMRAILAVVADNKQPDLPLVIEQLTGHGADLAQEYITRLNVLPCSTPQAIECAVTIKGLSTSRHLASAGAAIIEIAQDRRADSEGALAEAEALLREVRDKLPEIERSPDPADILRRLKQAGPAAGIALRFSPTLQEKTGGLQRGQFWVIGGFSSVGKSAVACNITFDTLHAKGKQVCIISTEMTQEQYMLRLMALVSGVPQRDLRDHVPNDFPEAAAVRKAETALSTANLKIYDTMYRMTDIRSTAKRLKETSGLDVLIVDFIQNVRGTTGDEFRDATEIAIDMQLLAKELNCTVVAFSQVSNEMAKYQQEGGDGNYYSWKGSGAIRDASDVGILLKRDKIKQSPILDMHIVKNRHGELHVIPCHIDLPTGMITEMEDEEEE